MPSGRHGVAADHRPRRARSRRSPTPPGPAVFNYGRDAVATATGELPGENVPTRPRRRRRPRRRPRPRPHAVDAPQRRRSTAASTATTSTTSTTSTTTVTAQTLPADTLYSVLPGGGTIGGGDDDGGDGEAAEDAFSNHWFTDSAAWPQVAALGRARRRRRRRRLLRRQALPQQLDRPRRRPSSRSSSPCTSSTRTSTGCCRRRSSRTFAARISRPVHPSVHISCTSRRSPASIAAVIRSSSFGHRWAYVLSVSLAFLWPRNAATARGEQPEAISSDAV